MLLFPQPTYLLYFPGVRALFRGSAVRAPPGLRGIKTPPDQTPQPGGPAQKRPKYPEKNFPIKSSAKAEIPQAVLALVTSSQPPSPPSPCRRPPRPIIRLQQATPSPAAPAASIEEQMKSNINVRHVDAA